MVVLNGLTLRYLWNVNSVVIFALQRTPYTQIKMTLTFPGNYPSCLLIVNVDQYAVIVISSGLKKKLGKGLNSLATDKAGNRPFDQVRTVCVR